MNPDTGVLTELREVAEGEENAEAYKRQAEAESLAPTRWQRRAWKRQQQANAEREAREREERVQARVAQMAAMPLGSTLPSGDVLVSAQVADLVRAGQREAAKRAKAKVRDERARKKLSKRSRARNR